jgi:hypothetical protein
MADNTSNTSSNGSASADFSGLDHVRQKSLKAAGWAYFVGDAALATSGILEKEYKTASAGALYGLGGLVLARYGNPHAEKRLQLLSEELGQYLKAQGAEIPKGSKVDAAMLAKDGGIIEHIERFLYRNPSQVLNTLFAIGGVELMRGGMDTHRHWKTASGALVIAGALAGLLIPEHKVSTETERPGGFFDKAWRWIQDKPLRASGYLYMANNATMTVDALLDGKKERAEALRTGMWKPKQYGYLFQLVTVASYILANALFASSFKQNEASKNKEEELSSMEELKRAAAEVIAAQPMPVRQSMIQKTAGYLSAKAKVNVSASELTRAMEQAVAQCSPTIGGWQQRVECRPSSSPTLHT